MNLDFFKHEAPGQMEIVMLGPDVTLTLIEKENGFSLRTSCSKKKGQQLESAASFQEVGYAKADPEEFWSMHEAYLQQLHVGTSYELILLERLGKRR